MAIPFTDKEMKKAWGGNLSASQTSPRTNAHRLLLFYAVECGLKAVLMARQETRRTNLCKDIKEAKEEYPAFKTWVEETLPPQSERKIP
jgi:hypothetical protein